MKQIEIFKRETRKQKTYPVVTFDQSYPKLLPIIVVLLDSASANYTLNE